MLIAGIDTTSTTIEWAFAKLVKNPKIMKKIQDELDHVVGHDRMVDEDDIPQLKYLQAVVKETFRFHATIPLITRECMTNCKVGGYDILAKTPIIVNLWAIHRHSSTYDDPWDFNLERFVGNGVDVKGVDFELLPFGSGRRACPGMPLGLMQVQYELARLLHSFTWKLPIGENPQNMDMGEVFGVTLPKVVPLELIPIARLPLHMYGPL
jgi:cytochrome P450